MLGLSLFLLFAKASMATISESESDNQYFLKTFGVILFKGSIIWCERKI